MKNWKKMIFVISIAVAILYLISFSLSLVEKKPCNGIWIIDAFDVPQCTDDIYIGIKK